MLAGQADDFQGRRVVQISNHHCTGPCQTDGHERLQTCGVAIGHLLAQTNGAIDTVWVKVEGHVGNVL